MGEFPNTTEPARKPRRSYQFGLRTLLVGVTLIGLLAGAVRWLIILFGVEIAGAVLIALLFAVSYAALCRSGLTFWQFWCRFQSNRDKAREIESTRILLELDEVREEIRAAKSGRLRDADRRDAETR